MVGTITLEDSHILVVDSNISHHHRHLTFLHKDLHISLLRIFRHKTLFKASSMNVQAVKFVENLDMEHWIVTIGRILLIKAKIILPSLLPWQVHLMQCLPAIKIPGLLILASDHLTANLNSLSNQSQYKGPKQVTVENGQSSPINHIGNTTLHNKYHNFILKNVIHVPRIAMNLLSVHKFCLHNSCSCYFDANQIKI